ncbi:MAG: ribosome maturation factor RimM [Mangrovibacterium sp.]
METIPKNDCLKIGYLQKPHGIKGEVVLNFEPEFETSLEEEPALFLEIDGLLVPYFLKPDGLRFRSGESALLQFDWVDDENQARQICGCAVYMKKEDWLDDEEELPLHMLVGYQLFDSKRGIIGTIEQVDDYAGNLIFQVTYNGQEVLIPFNEDFLVRFDEDNREIELQCPDGIFDL